MEISNIEIFQLNIHPLYGIIKKKHPSLNIDELYKLKKQLGNDYLNYRRHRIDKLTYASRLSCLIVGIIIPLIMVVQNEWYNQLAIFWYLFSIALNYAFASYIQPDGRIYNDEMSNILYDMDYESKLRIVKIKGIEWAIFKLMWSLILCAFIINAPMLIVLQAWNGEIQNDAVKNAICAASMIVPVYAYLVYRGVLKLPFKRGTV